MSDGQAPAEAVGEAVGDATATVVETAIEGAEARAAAAEQVAEAITDAALATATGQQIEQVERDTWREIAQLHERAAGLEARLEQQQEQLSTLTGTLLLSSDQQTALIAMLATQSTPQPQPTPQPELSPAPVNPAASEDAPASDPEPPARKPRHRFL